MVASSIYGCRMCEFLGELVPVAYTVLYVQCGCGAISSCHVCLTIPIVGVAYGNNVDLVDA